MELEKLGISKLSYSLQTYLKRSMFKSAREDEMRDDKEDSILDTARTVSSIQLGKFSITGRKYFMYWAVHSDTLQHLDASWYASR